MSDGCTHTVEKLRDLTHELQILYIFVLKYGDACLYLYASLVNRFRIQELVRVLSTWNFINHIEIE